MQRVKGWLVISAGPDTDEAGRCVGCQRFAPAGTPPAGPPLTDSPPTDRPPPTGSPSSHSSPTDPPPPTVPLLPTDPPAEALSWRARRRTPGLCAVAGPAGLHGGAEERTPEL